MAITVKKDFKNTMSAVRIRGLLNENCMSAQDLANRSGVSKASISQYLSGLYVPKNTSAKKIAEVFNVNPAWIMGLDVPKDLPDYNDVRIDMLKRYAETKEILACSEIEIVERLEKEISKLDIPDLQRLYSFIDYRMSVRRNEIAHGVNKEDNDISFER